MKKTFYEKVGRRYVPVYEYDQVLMDALPKGSHLIQVYPGGRSTRYNVDPAYAPMIAAGRFAEDTISKVIMEKSALRIPEKQKPLTEEQRAAWEHLAATLGQERYALEWCSYREAAEAGVKAMQDEADKMLTNPAVKKAWDYFLMVWHLTKEESFEDH
jgi:hypothetical protein